MLDFMYICSNIERIITSRTNSSFLNNKIVLLTKIVKMRVLFGVKYDPTHICNILKDICQLTLMRFLGKLLI